jgi:hypothetical protein
MSKETQKVVWPKSGAVALGVAIATLLFIFRFTAATALLVVILLFFLYPLHRSRHLIIVGFILFAVAILIPVDVYIPGWNGPLVNSHPGGPRLVQVLYGFRGPPKEGEAIMGGCVVGFYDTRWRLVWD